MMIRRSIWLWFVAAVLVGGLLAGCREGDDSPSASASAKTSEPEKPHFGYGPEDGPAQWASLDPAFAECGSGKEQSPTDLKGGTRTDLPSIEFAYKASPIELENNGHSVQANYQPGSSINIDGTSHELDQFHFHAPSEHTVDGRSFPLEFHFVYMDAAGNATVIGVLVKEGSANSAFAPLIAALPEVEKDGEHVALDKVAVGAGLNPQGLMPAGAGSGPRWSYDGSLTTPPCTEGIDWNVLRKPVELTAGQIATFTDIYDHTNRPVQPLNGRKLLSGGAVRGVG